MADTQQTPDWWASLKHKGLLLSPAQLVEQYSDPPAPLSRRAADRLRRQILRYEGAVDGSGDSGELLDTVLEEVVGLGEAGSEDAGRWLKGPEVPPDWTMRAVTGEAIPPRRVWQNGDGFALPVFFDDVSRIGVGHGKRSAARVLEWLRKADRKLALLTNGEQWRLVYAGLDHDAYAQWDTGLWFEEGEPSDQVTALRALLGPRSLSPPEEGADGALLLHAAEESRKGQADFSSEVGERVREAVEALIQAYGGRLDRLDEVDPQQIYLAATRVVMRLVVALFAEARDLLPRNNAIYHGSYGIEGLREELDRLRGSAGGERLRHRHGAWPRVVALFRLIHEGSPHEALPVPRYGGKLFRPGDPDADDPIRRALAVFEDPDHGPNDATVLRMLDYLCKGRMKVRQGRRRTWVEMPVDFSALSTEYIGILYEGLLDYQLRQVPADDAVVFLNLGDQPALPLSRLHDMDDEQVESLVDEFKTKQSKRRLKDLAEEDDEQDVEDLKELVDENGESAIDEDEWDFDEPEEAPVEGGEERVALREAAERWAVRAVKLGKLVRRPRSSDAAAEREWEEKCRERARSLIQRIVLPGEWYLVRFGSTRKGSGTFYTKPQLAVPTVQRTLRPLAYHASEEESSKGDTRSNLRPRSPEAILGLTVCDPACGSGSFLAGSLRYLTDALYESLWQHGRIEEQGETTLITLAEGEAGGERLDEELLPTRPDADDFEERLKGRLKRYVVERCIYGVDNDPLAVELCRISLWIETMDPELPFSFLDHKIKCGNSYVGCWFDRVLDYPALCCERPSWDAGDRTHDGVHFEKNARGEALKKFRNEVVKPELRQLIEGYEQISHDRPVDPEDLQKRHEETLRALQAIHELPIHHVEERRERYRTTVEENEEIGRLRRAMDAWCAAWFWPADRLETAPTPLTYLDPPRDTLEQVEELSQEHCFFHWELEFPDVFSTEGAGFDGIVGNPPWEILNPESKQFFSHVDPIYRTYGKQEALDKQQEYFENNRELEQRWLDYRARYKSLSNWVRNVGYPYGDGKVTGKGEGLNLMEYGGQWRESRRLHKLWGKHRSGRQSFADPEHPFRHQGSAHLNTYKLFLEVSHALLGPGGRLGMLTPSGLYSDKGSADLRTLLLTECQWNWLFGFENREGIFDIHRSQKFCALIAEKGDTTDAIRSSFMHRDVTDWEIGEAEDHALSYSRKRIEQFSPNSRAILELRSDRDLEVLARQYGNGVLLGDGDDSLSIEYQKGDFNVTSDSELFPPLPEWEDRGYRSDEYGHWLKGSWKPYDGPRSILERPDGLVLSPDGERALDLEDMEDVALPLYEGRMIGQFDFSQKGWVSGKGRSADWRDIGWDHKVVESQYLMGLQTARENGFRPGGKLAFMEIVSATNKRTFYGAIVNSVPCGDTAPFVRTNTGNFEFLLLLCAGLNSFGYDYMLRNRVGGLHLSWHYLEETAAPQGRELREALAGIAASLALPHRRFAGAWLAESGSAGVRWQQKWACTPHERLRLRCIADALIARLYGLDEDDFRWILRNCDHPKDRLSDSDFYQSLDPKSFRAVDKKKDPELRHTVLTLVAYHDLQKKGVDAFLHQNEGDGWMIPESLRLSGYGLGHDERAKKPQPVRSRLGPRFYDWQLEMNPEESWEACARHAELLGEVVPETRLVHEDPDVEGEPEEDLPLFAQG